MNFSCTIRQNDVTMELKYCERCGGLWLRRLGQDVVYCGSCQIQVTALLLRMQRRSGTKRNGGPAQVRIECLQGVAATAVRP